MPPAPRRIVELRAGWRCEYCRAPQEVCGYRFHVEHILPRARGGTDDISNLALACGPCNFAKGVRTVAVDLDTGDQVPLFNPRADRWEEHFGWGEDGCTLLGVTPCGRATAGALEVNTLMRLAARRHWRRLGLLS